MKAYPLNGYPMSTPKVEDQFNKGASLTEGVSGQLEINTEYENTCPPGDVHPRTKNPLPENEPEPYNMHKGRYDDY